MSPFPRSLHAFARASGRIFSQAQDLKAAVDVFRDMQKQRVKPGIISWCYLISNLTKIRRKGWPYQDIAYELWKEVSQEKSLEGKRDGMYYATGKHLRMDLLIVLKCQ